MAEAIAKSIASNSFNAYSAGSSPSGMINPKAIEILKNHDISTHNLISKSINDLQHIRFDAVITLCGSAHNEPCPIWVGDCIKAHWGFEDPSVLTDGPEKDRAFQVLFDELKQVITKFSELMQANPGLLKKHIKYIEEAFI